MNNTEKRIHNETYLRGDVPCMDCNSQENIIWSTKNVFWNDVMEGVDGSGILCVHCFAKRAQTKYPKVAWFLLPEFPWK